MSEVVHLMLGPILLCVAAFGLTAIRLVWAAPVEPIFAAIVTLWLIVVHVAVARIIVKEIA